MPPRAVTTKMRSNTRTRLLLSEAELLETSARVNKKIIGPMVHGFVLENFMSGGKPRFRRNTPLVNWGKLSRGSAGVGHPLVDSGKLADKAVINPVIEADAHGVTLKIRNPDARIRASANALHNGAAFSIPRRDRMRSFFWAMYYQAVDDGDTGIANRWKAAALSRLPGVTIVIYPRPWTTLNASQEQTVKNEYQREMQNRLNQLMQRRR